MGKADNDAELKGNSSRAADLIEEVSRVAVASYQNKMARYLSEIARMDGLDQLAVRRTLPSGALKYFQKVMELYDGSIQFLLGHLHHHGLTVQCKPQCNHCCCNMPSGVSTMELIYLYHAMEQSGESARLFRRCLEADESWVEVIRRNSGGESDLSAGGNLWGYMLNCYAGLGRPCPFLQNSMCLVYPYRPLACRMHFSLSPPHWCNPSHFQNEHAVRFNLEPGECVLDALERLNGRFQLDLSDVMVCGLLELTVNVMQFHGIRWI